MNSVVADFIEASRKASTLDHLSEQFNTALQRLGFDKWAYQLVNPRHDRDRKPVIVSSYPQKWVTHYIEKGYQHVDHVILKGPQQILPFTWSGLCKQYGMTAQQKQFSNESADNELSDGLGIPVHGANGAYAMVSMASRVNGDELQRLLNNYQKDIHIISLVYNTVARDLLEAQKFGSVVPVLSHREKECLLWMSRGKTAWDTAQILHVSEAAIKFHLANAPTKLGVTTTREALVFVIMKRLIEP
ncbi:LuxR family transcriptional regulator [Bradyrhizobium sp. 190]|uniref:LuxR family transcriptional regulator n=1 Tax=Bradyrhizobium sp. 190 TaxID=2782658 RepID=UPI001FF9B798|nr:LuxR family transcriptional regulator [Bradyrhizobium sp. 190]MCK1513051.1 LuxR family transcriptional regulator [Bradyrhizobium sp. 190]